MNVIGENLKSFFDRVIALFSSYNIISDTLDILLVAFIIFFAIKMLKETRGIQILKGLLLVGVLYIIINALNMEASTYLFKSLLGDFILVLFILFSPEIRHALETMGRSRFRFLNFFGAQQGDALYERRKSAILEICRACKDMSDKQIGALIVFENETQLGDVIKTGTSVDARVSKELIGSLFFPNSPLHDGAVIIRDGRICAAGCILPLTGSDSISNELGTRHRASVGLTEVSDAVCVVVSEETGSISVSVGGRIERGVSDGVLIERLTSLLLPSLERISTRTRFLMIKEKIKESFGNEK